MKHTPLQHMTVEQLAERFANIALEQYRAIIMEKNAAYRRLYSQMENVRQELKNRPGDQRRVLAPLLNHHNAQVRLKAAITLLAVEPDAARQALNFIKDTKEFPQAADAFGMIRALDDGSYVPT